MVSIKELLGSLLRNPMLSDLTLEYVLDYTLEFMRIVGVKEAFVTKEIVADIKDYRYKLPSDFYKIEGVYKNNERIVPRLSTRHSSMIEDNSLNYKIQGDYIITSFKEGKLTIRYLAIPIDNEGYIQIPDDSVFLRALESYIKVKQFTILFESGKINGNILQDARQQYAWHVGQAQSRMIDVDTMESIVRANSILLDKNRFSKDFKV